MKIYVDGENFRHGVAGILQRARLIESSRTIEYYPLRSLLADVLGIEELQISYYAAKIKLPRGYDPSPAVQERADQIRELSRKWVAGLVQQNIEYTKAGYLKLRSSEPCSKCGRVQESLVEKGVDVRIAVDIISDSHVTDNPIIALLSSDSDLIPALDRLKTSVIKVIYICFADSVNRAMSSMADETITIPILKVQQLYKEATNGK